MNNVSVEEHHHHSVKHPAFAKIIHFFKWWLGLTGLIAATSVCPFCGQPGCPVGVGAATTIGGILSLFMQDWKEPFRRLYRRFSKKDVRQ
jgi:hypothetical protein